MLFPLRDYRPSRRFPLVTVFIIAINVLVFLYQSLVLGDNSSGITVRIGGRLEVLSQFDLFLFRYGVTPCEVLSGCAIFPQVDFPIWLTLFSSMFVHGDLLHISSNMWFLWIFGDNVEDEMGKGRFFVFYLVAGLGAALAQVIFTADSNIPMVGASGAIAGVLGAYMILHPYARVLTLVFVVFFVRFLALPAILVLGYWFLIQVISSMLGGGGLQGGVAYMAHIGGFLVGAILVRAFAIPPHGRSAA